MLTAQQFPSLVGLGAGSDWDAFKAGGTSATYEDPKGITYCNKDRANRVQCVLNAYPPPTSSRSGPVADAQRATDRFLGLVPSFHLQNLEIKAQVPQADGSYREEVLAIPPGTWNNPILSESGYDGIVGASTAGNMFLALEIAGSLADMPSDVAPAFLTGRATDLAARASAIARWLNYVSDHMATLLAAYRERARPSPALVPEAIPVVREALKKKKKFPWGIVAAAVFGGGALVTLTIAATRRRKPKGHAARGEAYA
jgi:hypothetical protein